MKSFGAAKGVNVDSGWMRWVRVFMACMALAGRAAAGDSPTNSLKDSTELSLDQLINIQVTSVSKKETSLNDSPAAISVITQDDIRRSGMTTLPELLRMVPGFDVGRIDGNEWAVSSRGFNSQFARDLLVLIDGRTVYTPSSAGVFWNAQDVVLEDLDRIEVIRGPGATLWGANAVNGVVNIITKSAAETQGGLVSTSLGTEELPTTSARYGGQIATNLYYRVYVKYFNREGLLDAAGNGAPDGAEKCKPYQPNPAVFAIHRCQHG
jgi:iron complex outermembrane receptor protein